MHKGVFGHFSDSSMSNTSKYSVLILIIINNNINDSINNDNTLSSDAPAAALRETPYNMTNVIGDGVVTISTSEVVSTLELVRTFITLTLLLIE